MRNVSVIICLLACATPLWAGLDHIPVVTSDARSFVALSRVAPIDNVVPEVTGALSALPVAPQATESAQFVGLGKTALVSDVVPLDLPRFSRFSGAESLVATAPTVAAMGGTVHAVDVALPRFSDIGGVTVQEVDPFLTWYDIWSEGALGELRSAAMDAAKRGDDAAYRRLTERYWAGVIIASERRQLHAPKPADIGKGVRAVRRNSR